MEPAWAITLAVLAAFLPSLLLVLFLYFLTKRLWQKYCAPAKEPIPIDRRDAALQRSALMASLWRSSVPLRAFQWSDHPSHVITALEHGWAAFAFSYATSAMTSLLADQMWEICSTCNAMKFFPPEITWTEDCLQQIRLNPGVRSNKDGCVLPVQALQTALPVPGPLLGPVPYPQEAYFEMVVWNEMSSECSSMAGSERVKLIAKTVTASDRYRQNGDHGEVVDEKDLSSKEGEQEEEEEGEKGDEEVDWDELLSVGLAGAEAPPFRLLGFDPGSVGFLSADGQCYVNGMPYSQQGRDMTPPTKGRPWGAVGKTTVGCGFDPKLKRVYFTINGELVHEAFLKSPDFANPLYPTIASNYDVTVLVNLGQRIFEYVPANVTRVANPCCRILQARTFKNTSFFDDDITSDLFSMGRFDSHWLANLEYANSQEHCYGHSEAESDLFEIVLDGQGLKR